MCSTAGRPNPIAKSDPVNPLSVYGKSKAEGERLLLATGAPCLIIRTSWVYSAAGKNFLKTIAGLAGERPELSIVGDQVGTPASAVQIAGFVRALVSRGLAGMPALFEASSGLVHFTASGWTSWHGFACAIVADEAARRTGEGGGGEGDPKRGLSNASRAAAIFAVIYGEAGARF